MSRESLERMHYVSYPTVRKSALGVGVGAGVAGSAARRTLRMLMRTLHLIKSSGNTLVGVIREMHRKERTRIGEFSGNFWLA